jgi:hypothetical protein
MRNIAASVIVVASSAHLAAQTSVETAQAIAAAVPPLPPQLREGAAVVSLDASVMPVALRAGSNALVCIADRPGDDVFDVRCYHKDFIDVVYRSFQLGGSGTSGPRVTDTIERELKDGRLKMTLAPTFGYRMLGPVSAFNAASMSVGREIRSWQSIHLPYKTTPELGVIDQQTIPQNQRTTIPMPYTMASGTYWSHVMIVHPEGAHLGH